MVICHTQKLKVLHFKTELLEAKKVEPDRTFLVDTRILQRELGESFFRHEQSHAEFEKRQAQYCSICSLESLTGTQYSMNLEAEDLHSYATKCLSLSLNSVRSMSESVSNSLLLALSCFGSRKERMLQRLNLLSHLS